MNRTRHSALAVATLCCGLLLAAGARAEDRPVVKVGRYRLQSNPWVNLHQRLVYEARLAHV